MKIADLGSSRASKLKHFAKIGFSQKNSLQIIERFQNLSMILNIFQKLTRAL